MAELGSYPADRPVNPDRETSRGAGSDPGVSFQAVPTPLPSWTDPGPEPEGRPCPYRARAWWGDVLLADTTGAVRIDRPDAAPLLCFPLADVRVEHLPTVGDRAVGWTFADPPPGAPGLRDHTVFDHEVVRVELVDTLPGDAPGGETVKRFPTWGDAADLIDILDVRPDGDHRYTSVGRADWRRPVVEGSQMLGQALVAAGRHAPGRRPVSAHMAFPRAADATRPLAIELGEVSAGRTFTTLSLDVSQGGRCCGTGTALLDVTAPDVIRHAPPPPDVPGPAECEPYDMAVTGRDLRIVDGAYTGDPDAPTGPPTLDAWVRFRSVPDDPCLHAALLAQFTGHMSIAAALRPHAGIGQDQAHRTLSTAINAIGISFHREVRADRWMLYRHRSTFAGDGMTHAECRVHDEAGELLASFTVDAMVRAFAGATTGLDAKTAL